MTSHLRTYSGQWQYMDATTEGKHFRVQCTFNRGDALLFEATAVLVHTVVSSCFPMITVRSLMKEYPWVVHLTEFITCMVS